MQCTAFGCGWDWAVGCLGLALALALALGLTSLLDLICKDLEEKWVKRF